MAYILLSLRVSRVGEEGGAVSGESFDEGGEEAEGCYYAARVKGGVVGDVVEDSAHDDIVCELVDGRGAVDHAEGDDIDVYVFVIVGPYLAIDVADDEEEGCND